jgi:hypothetical protein
MRDEDLLIMQHSALHIPHDYMVNTILHRFGILDWIADGMDAARGSGSGVRSQPSSVDVDDAAAGRMDREEKSATTVGPAGRSPSSENSNNSHAFPPPAEHWLTKSEERVVYQALAEECFHLFAMLVTALPFPSQPSGEGASRSPQRRDPEEMSADGRIGHQGMCELKQAVVHKLVQGPCTFSDVARYFFFCLITYQKQR